MAATAIPAGPVALRRVRTFFSLLGPGLITGAADDDPSGIATFSIAGASFGYALLWSALFTIPLMIGVQMMCARLGIASGRGLAGAIRARYPRWILWGACTLLISANVINIGADLGAMGETAHMVLPLPMLLWTLIFAGLILALMVLGHYRFIAQFFKWATLSLLSYVIAAVLAHPEWLRVLRFTFIPKMQLSREYLATLVAILGTSISPYLFFWQSSQEVEEQRALGRATVRSRRGATQQELKNSRQDVVAGMIFSNLVVYFIVVTTAATLHAHGLKNIASAREAAEALKPLAGAGAYWLFTAGIIGTGMLAVPVLAGSCAYAVAEGATWRASLEDRARRAPEFYGVLAIALLLGLGINFMKLNAVRMLFWAAVVNGVLAPPLIVLLLFLTRDGGMMAGKQSPAWVQVLGWVTALFMMAATVLMFVT